MSKQAVVEVLRTVLVSDDGIRTREIVKGTHDTVPADAFEGLEKEGYVKASSTLVAQPAPAAPAPAAPPADAPVLDREALQSMKVAGLVTLAEEHKIDLGEARKKDDLIEIIAAALAPKAA
jgi:hypothetical protein